MTKISESSKKNFRNMVKKYGEDPDSVLKEIADKYGLEYVESKKEEKN